MTITFSTIKAAIKRHLSIIGKRTFTKDGQNQFSQITVSTAEDPIFEQYIVSGAQNVEAALRQLLVQYTATVPQSIEIVLRNTRGTTDFDTRCGDMISTYITLFSVGEYLAMTHPEMAQKYQADADGSMQSLMAYAYHKEPPKAATANPLAIDTTVS